MCVDVTDWLLRKNIFFTAYTVLKNWTVTDVSPQENLIAVETTDDSYWKKNPLTDLTILDKIIISKLKEFFSGFNPHTSGYCWILNILLISCSWIFYIFSRQTHCGSQILTLKVSKFSNTRLMIDWQTKSVNGPPLVASWPILFIQNKSTLSDAHWHKLLMNLNLWCGRYNTSRKSVTPGAAR